MWISDISAYPLLVLALTCVSCPIHQSAPSLFLKSNFEYLRGNYRKAVKLLNSSNIAEHPGPIKTGDNSYISYDWWLSLISLASKTMICNVNVLNGAFKYCLHWRYHWNIWWFLGHVMDCCIVLSHSGECVRCMFWNNLGCIHFAMGKHNLGIFYFKKALQENDHTCAQLGDGSNGQCGSQQVLFPEWTWWALKWYWIILAST